MDITITSLPTTNRPGKGKSLISFPTEYCIVDVETTGLSPKWDNIIEIGVIRYKDGIEIDRFQSLVQPPAYDDGTFVDAYIEALTGITNEMLAGAPLAADVLPAFLEFIKNDMLLGYNVSFDVNFLYDACERYLGKPLANDYFDVLRLARKLCTDLPSHRLKDLAGHYCVERDGDHRSISDCESTEKVYRKLLDDGISQHGNLDALTQLFKRHRTSGRSSVRASEIVGDEDKAQPDCPIYQRHCCITGKLELYTRKEAMQLIADLGGINDNGVTKATNILILGNNDYCATIKDGKSSKQKKAEAAKVNGQDIEIMPESVFYDMIAEYVRFSQE